MTARLCSTCGGTGVLPTGRFDPAPLLALFDGLTHVQIGERLGVHRETVCRWAAGHRRINRATADVVCLRAGLHPENVWPGEW